MRLPANHQETSATTRRSTIRKLLQDYEEIPTVPSLVETVTTLTEDVNSSIDALEQVIKTDPSCVARLLQMANTAFYGSGTNRMVTSVRRVILMFGFNAVKNLTLNLTTFDCFQTKNTEEIATVQTLRLHSLAVATLAQRIAKTSPRDIDDDLAFCAGLLHDIGRVVLLHLFPQEYHRMLTQMAGEPDVDMSKVEFDTFEVTHAVAGQWLGEHWHFPAPILQVIATHHSTHAANPLVATVMLANALVHKYGVGFGGTTRSSNISGLLRLLGLPPRHAEVYLRYLDEALPHLLELAPSP
ncbi:MAG: HDOD domain-containing protein [Candidatus Tectomicrobia bacterium]|uniref:HDOD domain-containing protein n=1 Tax=Tectimicrobiota bacterium TaxID=2528274 RepID=A0A937W2W8_UNCTE|nr:HDOD domain-containing protein [Candidatus Tectomicrobia bacterium]